MKNPRSSTTSELEFKQVGEIGHGVEFRGAPFWSWNDELDEEELRRQVRMMKDGGLGGFFIHSRIGLRTKYMGEAWMKCVAACIDEAKKQGMQTWLYDEDGFPSGCAGGLVPTMGDEYARHGLFCRERLPRGIEARHPNTLKHYIAVREGRTLRDLVDVTKRPFVATDYPDTLSFEFYVDPGEKYVDTMNPKVAQRFLEVAYEPYAERLKHEFGPDANIPGIFTDEPQIAWFNLPWTATMPDEFRTRRGYDLLEHLPSLFYEVGPYTKIRHDYWRTATELFVENFTRPLYVWCENHRLKLTGHANENEHGDLLHWQIAVNGAVMPHYEYMQIPGIDHLGVGIIPMDRYTIPLGKQVGSVAHQLGGRRVLCEIFGNFGQHMTFAGQSWTANWLFCLGVDLFCQHLTPYSVRGLRKRDCPPMFNDLQPWWPWFHLLNNRFARISYMLTRGRHVADILVLHPLTSAWSVFHLEHRDPVTELNDAFIDLSQALLNMHRDFDYGDEMIMLRHATVRRRKLCIGDCAYSIVVVPRCLSIFPETFELLKKFAQAGGKLISFEPLPSALGGEPSDELTPFLQASSRVVKDFDRLRDLLDEMIPAPFTLTHRDGQGGPVYCQAREDGDRRIFFLFNTCRDKDVTTIFTLYDAGRLEWWDPDTGERSIAACRSDNLSLSIDIRFPAGESRILVLERNHDPEIGTPAAEQQIINVAVQPSYTVRRGELNALVLDYCDYRIEGEEWVEDQPLLLSLARPAYGPPPEPLDRLIQERGAGARLDVRFRFQVDELPEATAPLFLVIETPDAFEIQLNGSIVENVDQGFWLDHSFRKLDIHGMLQPGANVLELSTATTLWLEVDHCMIVGAFGVRRLGERNFAIAPEPPTVDGINLVEEGYSFYCGPMTLEAELELPSLSEAGAHCAVLEIDQPDATVVSLVVNGEPCGVRAWADWHFNIGDQLRNGMNQIAFTLAGTARNLLGNFHNPGPIERDHYPVLGETWNHPWQREYSFAPFGLDGVAVRYYRRA